MIESERAGGGGANPEILTLVACLRDWIAGGSVAQLRARAAPDLNWVRLLESAQRHGVLPLAWRSVCAIGPDVLGTPALNRFRAESMAHRQRSLFLTAELLDILRIFHARSLRAMPLKGPVWASALYGDVALRQYADLDILVTPNDAARACELLMARGFSVRSSHQHTAITAVRAGSMCDVTVDLQWALADPHFRFPMDDRIWQGARRRDLAGTGVWYPSAVDQLVILCGHPAKHSWSRLGWICDIAAFVARHRELAWCEALNRARDLGGERLLLVGLLLARDILHVEIPPGLLRRIEADRRVTAIARDIRGRLSGDPPDQRRIHGSYGLVEGTLLYIRSRERFTDKCAHAAYTAGLLRICFRVTPSNLDRAVVRLPPSLAFLYYAVRPIRLIRQYGRLFVVRAGQAMTCWR